MKRLDAMPASSSTIKKLKFDELHRFKKKGNEDQYRLSLKVGDAIEEAKEACSPQQLDKVHASLEKGEKLLSESQKHIILLAGKSDFGWSLIREYKRNDLAEDSDDEKRFQVSGFRFQVLLCILHKISQNYAMLAVSNS